MARRACRATRPSAWRPGTTSRRRWRAENVVSGPVTGKVKGGLTVMVNGIRAFLPGSLVDIRPVKDTTPFEGKPLEFKVIKLDRKRNNVVVSRRAVLEAGACAEREELLEDAAGRRDRQGRRQEHHRLRRVRRLGRHRRPAAHHRPGLAPRESPVRSASVGDEVTAKVLKFDQEKNRVSLGMKQLGDDPWAAGAPLSDRHAPVRQGHQHHRLRRLRRDRAGHRRPGSRLRNGLDQQERPSVQGRAAGRRSRSHGPGNRRGAPPHLASA